MMDLDIIEEEAKTKMQCISTFRSLWLKKQGKSEELISNHIRTERANLVEIELCFLKVIAESNVCRWNHVAIVSSRVPMHCFKTTMEKLEAEFLGSYPSLYSVGWFKNGRSPRAPQNCFPSFVYCQDLKRSEIQWGYPMDAKNSFNVFCTYYESGTTLKTLYVSICLIVTATLGMARLS